MSQGGPFFLRGLTVTPGRHAHRQMDLAAALHARLSALPDAQTATKMVGFVYAHSDIRERRFELDLDEIDSRTDWYRMVNEATWSLGHRALLALFSDGLSASQCDGLVVVSSTYAGFPSLSRRLQEPFGFPLSALCFDLTGLGCAGPIQGLLLAHNLVAQGNCRNVCVLCVDAMGTHGQSRRHAKPPAMEQLVAHCLASDGAAAAVVGRDYGPRTLLAYREASIWTRLWSDSLALNDLTASEDNQPLIAVGKDIRTRMTDELSDLLTEEVVRQPLFFHPGGKALMKALEERHPPLRRTAELSLSILDEFGNVGSPSVLFVFKKALEARMRVSPMVRLAALGPGIVTAALCLEGVEEAP
jgi:alkylresorcinol/alkylpyrone synthase